ncbi:hypothetical protein L596_021087 [Steinernema carpocapsae]|uniref:Uncharacterized protein n=1 Tax=Steinernema carpocapsae TaxID=34508 RepID=A0A4U5MVP0_STECR|nr:hypothetical protein L596_021087 [Steinernema carpocapsae]
MERLARFVFVTDVTPERASSTRARRSIRISAGRKVSTALSGFGGEGAWIRAFVAGDINWLAAASRLLTPRSLGPHVLCNLLLHSVALVLAAANQLMSPATNALIQAPSPPKPESAVLTLRPALIRMDRRALVLLALSGVTLVTIPVKL